MNAKLATVVLFLLGNKTAIAASILALIGAASLVIKTLEGIVKLLVTVFPSLKTMDDELVGFAAWIDGLSKAGWLNTLAASPKPTVQS